MNESIQEKQAYLREKVLEKAYDADEFMSFLQLKKGENGLDLNNWTMNELKNIVNEFIHNKDKENEPEEEEINTNLNKKDELEEEEKIIENENQNQNQINENENQNQNQINENQNQNQNQNQINENLNSDNKKENLNIKVSNENISSDYLEFINCRKNEFTSLSNEKSLTIKLSSPQKIDEGLFSKSFISYVVSTEPIGYKTNKRYSDFSWLKKILSMIYPNCVIPPLCKKNFGDRFSDALISKRMRSIEKFMDGIVEHPLLKNSELTFTFLSAGKKEEYKKKIKPYQKIKKPTNLAREMKTMDGYIKIGINKEKVIYSENIQNYAQGYSYLLQKITKSYKSLMNIMQQLSDKMKDISKLFKLVLDKSIKYFDSHNTSETFNIMSKFMEDWSNIQKNQIKIMNENIREYFRYVKNEFNGLKEMSIKVKNSKNQYIKANEKLHATKENLFTKQDLDLWQLKEEDKPNRLILIKNKDLAFSKMLPNDTMKVSELRNYYGCMLNSLIEEFERIRKINAKRHKLNITNFIRLLSSQCTNLHVCLADRLSEFNQLKDENDIHNIDGGIQLKKVENLVDITNEEVHNNNNNDDFDFENIDYVDEEGNIRNENPKEDNMKNNNKEKNKKEEIKNEKIVNEEDIKKDEIKENKNENNEEKNKNEEDDKKENKNEENNKENNKNENKIDDNKNE